MAVFHLSATRNFSDDIIRIIFSSGASRRGIMQAVPGSTESAVAIGTNNNRNRRQDGRPYRRRFLFNFRSITTETVRRRRMTSMGLRAAAFAAAFIFSTPFMAIAADGATSPESPALLVEQTTTQIMAAIRQERETIRLEPARIHQLVDSIVVPHMDFVGVARLALGKQWRRVTRDQRARFADEFRTMLMRTYVSALTEFADVSIHYRPARMSREGRRAVVRADIRYGAEGIVLEYRLHRRNGEWKAYDIVVQGVSLVASYRASFTSEIRRNGIDALIERLAAANREHLQSAPVETTS